MGTAHHTESTEKTMADINAIAQQFVNHYYSVFSTNRPGLASLYAADSMLTFEGDSFKGTEQIIGKLTTLNFQSVKHAPQTLDVQPTPSGILVFISGSLYVDGSELPLKFAQVFHLLPAAGGSYYVSSDIFRLNYGM